MIYLLERTLPLLQVTTELDCEFVDFQRTLYIVLSAQHQIDPQGQHLLRGKNFLVRIFKTFKPSSMQEAKIKKCNIILQQLQEVKQGCQK